MPKENIITETSRNMIPMLTDLKVDILLMLSDNQGYSNLQLADKLKKEASNISKPLGELENGGLIAKKFRENKGDKRRSDRPYYLNEAKSIVILESILDRSIKTNAKLQDVLSNNNFIKFIITNSNLTSFLNACERYSISPKIRKIISDTVLANEVVIEECRIFIEKVISCPNDSGRFSTMIKARRLVEILQSFDTIDALYFYKNTINKSYSVLFGKIAAEEKMNYAELLKAFLEYDIELSPFTSYPVNEDPILLLFMRPFERIYDDIYLLEKSDRDIMVKRAYFIYSNFDKILLSGIRSMRTEEEGFEAIMEGEVYDEESYEKLQKDHFIRYLRKDLFYKKTYLNPLIKELIFYWNIASLRLDWIYYAIKGNDQISPGTKKRYHIKSDSNGIRAINLDDYKNVFYQETTQDAMMITALWSGEGDPFSTLRYCSCFKDYGLEKTQIKIKKLISDIQQSLYPE